MLSPTTRSHDTSGVLVMGALIGLLTMSSIAIPLGLTRWAMVTVVTVWMFFMVYRNEGITMGLSVAVCSGLAAGALFGLANPDTDQTPGSYLRAFAAFAAIVGFFAAILRPQPPTINLNLYRQWLETSLFLGLGIGFTALAFEEFKVAADASSRATFAIAIFGGVMFVAARVGMLLGRGLRRLTGYPVGAPVDADDRAEGSVAPQA